MSLLERLARGTPEERLEANEALLELVAAGELLLEPPYDPELVRSLGDRFGDEPLLVRMGFYFCLQAMGDGAVEALPGLARALEDPRNDCRAQAADLIAGLGCHAAPITSQLIEALCDEAREDVREAVALALASIAFDMSELEQHPSPYVREGALLIKQKRSSQKTMRDQAPSS